MSDALDPRPATPFSPEGAAPPAAASADPLAGDWSEGLRGPLRAHGIATPRLLAFTDSPPPVAAQPEAPAPASAETAALEDTARVTDAQAWSSAVAAQPPPEAAPTPWSEPVASEPPPQQQPDPEPSKDAPVPAFSPAEQSASPWDQVTARSAAADVPAPAADDTWSAPPAAEPVLEWSEPPPAGDWQASVSAAPAAVLAPSAAADWGTLTSGPDWSSAPPSEAAPAEQTWDSAPPAEPTWDATPAAEQTPAADWSPPAGDASAQWSAPEQAPAAPPATVPQEAPSPWAAPAAAPAQAAAWNSAPVGASALEQLDSEPPEPIPGAAAQLFGSVPQGGSLAGEEEAGELGPPEELASPEEFLKPVEIDDPDLLVPIEEDAPPPSKPPAQRLAIVQPQNPLFVAGEHRVAVHTRGGRTRRGSVTDVDLSKSQFPLVPQGGGDAEPVYHAEVKAIFFMLEAGEKPQPADGGNVRVTFADGRNIEGTRDGAEAKHGFFLVPSDAARTNTRRIYVAREATTDIKDG